MASFYRAAVACPGNKYTPREYLLTIYKLKSTHDVSALLFLHKEILYTSLQGTSLQAAPSSPCTDARIKRVALQVDHFFRGDAPWHVRLQAYHLRARQARPQNLGQESCDRNLVHPL